MVSALRRFAASSTLDNAGAVRCGAEGFSFHHKPSFARSADTSGDIGVGISFDPPAKFREWRVQSLLTIKRARGLSRRAIAERSEPHVEPSLPVTLALWRRNLLNFRLRHKQTTARERSERDRSGATHVR
jgi:hypothetical protein